MTNTWSLMPAAPWHKVDPELGRGPIGHAHDNNAGDVAGGVFFHRQYGTPQVRRYNIAKKTWEAQYVRAET